MHYICTGTCKGVSDKEGVCQAQTCPKHGMPLEACDCADGKHFGRQDHDAEASQKEAPPQHL